MSASLSKASSASGSDPVGVAFAGSHDRFEQVVAWLDGDAAAGLSHAELEDRLDTTGRELLRQLLADHLDLRAQREVRVAVVDADGLEHRAVEAGHTRALATVFAVTRLTYRRRGHPNLHHGDAALNLPVERHSHGLRRLAAVEASRGSFVAAVDAIERATGQTLGKRQVEQLAARAAVDFDDYYTQRPPAAADVGDVLVLSRDGKGIVLRADAEPQMGPTHAAGPRIEPRSGLAPPEVRAAEMRVAMRPGRWSGQDIPPQLVILARSDVPADALASGPVGGVLGAPVLLTPSTSLLQATADALSAMAPDVVVLAGGEAALSPDVEQAVTDLGLAVRRAAGADRHETAVLVSALLAEFSTGRPVLTGTPVADHTIPGLDAQFVQGMTPDDLVGDLHTRLDALESAVAGQDDRIETLEAANTGLTQRVADLEALLAGVTRPNATTLRIEGLNLQLVNGTGDTDGDPNGLGNLIIGYNAQHPDFLDPAERTGSHYLVVGDRHEWTAFGGIVAGLRNTASGDRASVTGGRLNTASGTDSSVSGGQSNVAEGVEAWVGGGKANSAGGEESSVSGGRNHDAAGVRASILGGAEHPIASDTFNECHPSCE